MQPLDMVVQVEQVVALVQWYSKEEMEALVILEHQGLLTLVVVEEG